MPNLSRLAKDLPTFCDNGPDSLMHLGALRDEGFMFTQADDRHDDEADSVDLGAFLASCDAVDVLPEDEGDVPQSLAQWMALNEEA